MKYDNWVIEELKGHTGMSAGAIPFAGWTVAAFMFGFYLPIKYLIRKK